MRFFLQGRSFFDIIFSATSTLRKRRKCLPRAGTGGLETGHVDYTKWIIKRCIRLPVIIPVLLHITFIRHFISTIYACVNTLPPAASSVSASSWLPSGMPSHASVLCVSQWRAKLPTAYKYFEIIIIRIINYNFEHVIKKNEKVIWFVTMSRKIGSIDELMQSNVLWENLRFS